MDTKEPYVRTVKGTVITFLNPKRNQIKIDEIAWALSRTCRYGSHIDMWYSNAEHTLMGCNMASNSAVARDFFVHDFAEYVFGDVVSPIKRLCSDYSSLQDRFQSFLNTIFVGKPQLVEEVKLIDKRITATEQKLLRRRATVDEDAKPYDSLQLSDFKCLSWQDAYFAFSKKFENLFPEYTE